MRQDNGCVTRSPLKNSQRFSGNTSGSQSAATSVLMKKKGEEFLPGDLVFAEFPGYSWPALVTQVGAKTLEVVTLILEQDELIDKNNAVIFQGMDQLKKIMSVLTPGEQQDFAEASNSLMELSVKSRQERLDIIKTGRSDSDEGESSKENEVVTADKETPIIDNPKPAPKVSPKKDSKIDSNGVIEIKKLSCDIDDITLPLVGSRLEKIIDHPRPKLTLEVGIPNFGTLDAQTVSSEGESEIEVKLQKKAENITPSENGTSPSKRKKLQVKQQRDEDYIANAVKLTNKLFETGGHSVELTPGHHLSYDSLKVARERAMVIAGCASPIISRTRRKSATKSSETIMPSPADMAAKAHAEHLKATRAAQKKALKSIGKPLEIVQTTAKNPSKRPGRKSSTTANGADGINSVLNKIAAEIAFQEAAEKLVVNSEKIATDVVDPGKVLQAAAAEAAQELVSPSQSLNNSSLKSPVRKRRQSKRHCCAENNGMEEIIVNSKSVLEIQKSLSPQKIVSSSVVQQKEEVRREKIKATRCENLRKARESKVQRVSGRKSKDVTPTKSPAKSSPQTLSKKPSISSTSSPVLSDEPLKPKEQVSTTRNANLRTGKTKETVDETNSQLLDTPLEDGLTESSLKSSARSTIKSPIQLGDMQCPENTLPVVDKRVTTPVTKSDASKDVTAKSNSTRKSKRFENACQAFASASFDQEAVSTTERRSSRRNKQPIIEDDCTMKNKESCVEKEDPPVEKEVESAPFEQISHSTSLEKSDQSRSSIKSNPAEEPNSSNVDVINFLCPYYLNLFTNVIKDKIENQIKLDLEKLPQEEQELILRLVEGTNKSARKQAYDIISKLVKNSPCQNLLTSNLPEVGPGTPPASPKTELQRISNKVIPQTRKRNSHSNCQEILHNPFPIETTELNHKSRMKYMESGGISKKHPVIPRTWSQYLKNNGRFVTEQSKSNSVADKIKSPSEKHHNRDIKKPNKRKKTDSPRLTKEEKIDVPSHHKAMALLLYVKDVQITLPNPLKLKQSEVKWTDLNSESQSKYIELCEKLSKLSAEDKKVECTALDLYVKSSSNISRLDWLSLTPTKQKKFLRDAKKVSKKIAASLAEANEFSEKLVAKLVSSESRKRKRESQPVDTDSEPSSKKEKSDDTLLDFFCLDCFTLGQLRYILLSVYKSIRFRYSPTHVTVPFGV